jgi:hypothetical protein
MTQLDATVLREFLGLAAPPTDVPVEVVDSTRLRGHRRLRLQIGCPDGDTMPAFLLVPDGAQGAAGVVVFHQHASQWHLGESEVCGLDGDPSQAFGPALVDHYRAADHEDRLHGDIATGGHALTSHRSRAITDWVIHTATGT